MSEQLQSSLNIGSQDSHINLAKASPVLFPRKNIANYFKSISSRAFYSLTINKITKKITFRLSQYNFMIYFVQICLDTYHNIKSMLSKRAGEVAQHNERLKGLFGCVHQLNALASLLYEKSYQHDPPNPPCLLNQAYHHVYNSNISLRCHDFLSFQS